MKPLVLALDNKMELRIEHAGPWILRTEVSDSPDGAVTLDNVLFCTVCQDHPKTTINFAQNILGRIHCSCHSASAVIGKRGYF